MSLGPQQSAIARLSWSPLRSRAEANGEGAAAPSQYIAACIHHVRHHTGCIQALLKPIITGLVCTGVPDGFIYLVDPAGEK